MEISGSDKVDKGDVVVWYPTRITLPSDGTKVGSGAERNPNHVRVVHPSFGTD